jgi:hypothetical protein
VTYYTRLGSEIISLIHLQDGMLKMVGQLRMLDQFRSLRSRDDSGALDGDTKQMSPFVMRAKQWLATEKVAMTDTQKEGAPACAGAPQRSGHCRVSARTEVVARPG